MSAGLLIYIVRHGETDENRQGIIQGQMDTQLNDAGRAQAAATGKALEDVNFIAAYSSDSARAADTARAIVAHHSNCELILDPRLRERNMGSLSGTKAPARRPLPSSVEPSHSIAVRLNDFWDSTIVPRLAHSSSNTLTTSNEGISDGAGLLPNHATPESPSQPAILLVSHGATISKLIRDVLLQGHGYTTACDLSRGGIYNTSVSILRLQVDQKPEQDDLAVDIDNEAGGSTRPPTVSGELVVFASIAHLIKSKAKKVVKENADMLEQRSL